MKLVLRRVRVQYDGLFSFRWNHQIEADHEQRGSDETAARHDVEVQALMAEVDRLGIDNRRLIRQVEQLMGTQDVAASMEPKSQGGAMTPRGTRRGQPAQQEEDPGIGRIEHEVAKLHNVIAEMAEREERLLRMLQMPDVKPDPGPIKKGDFVRKNRALVHHTSSFNSLLRKLRKEVKNKQHALECDAYIAAISLEQAHIALVSVSMRCSHVNCTVCVIA